MERDITQEEVRLPEVGSWKLERHTNSKFVDYASSGWNRLMHRIK